MRRGLLVGVVVLVVAGCGGDDGEPAAERTATVPTEEPAAPGPQQVASDYMRALEVDDAQTMCELLTPEARRAVEAIEDGPPCSSLVGAGGADLRLREPIPRRTNVEGNQATVEFNGADQRQAVVTLTRVDGQWRVRAITA
jgi:hypothetical protein